MSKRRIYLLFVAIILLLLTSRKLLVVSGESMAPTLQSGQIIWVNNKLPARGDISVIVEPDSGKKVVKRCVAINGDKVQIIKNSVYVNDKRFHQASKSIHDLLPIWTANDAALDQIFDLSSGNITFNNGWWGSSSANYQTSLLNPPQKIGHGLKLQCKLNTLNSVAAIVIRRGSLSFTLEINAKKSSWRVVVSGGLLPSSLEIGSGELAKTENAVYQLYICLANDECVAYINNLQVGGATSLADYGAWQPEASFNNEQLSINLSGGCDIREVEIGSEINYQVSGNFGVGTVFRLAADEYYLLGDNSSLSRDSRHYGAINQAQIIGVATRLWPRGINATGWPFER